MWIRQTPAELSQRKRHDLLRILCGTLLGGAALDCVLFQVHSSLAEPMRDSSLARWSVGMTCAFLPAWYFTVRARRKLRTTLICDRCNIVKSTDREPTCKCGGNFFPLLRAKWIAPTQTESEPAKRQHRPLAQAVG